MKIITLKSDKQFTGDDLLALLSHLSGLHDEGRMTLEQYGTFTTLMLYGWWLMCHHPLDCLAVQESVMQMAAEENVKPENNQ